MENDKINEKCWVACFDILGFKNKVDGFVTQHGEGHLDCFVKVNYEEILDKAKEKVAEHKELLEKIEHAWFSDTFIFYTPTQPQHSGSVIASLAQQFFLNCVWKRLAFRGALSVGAFYASKKESIFVGPALIDAHEYEKKQNWIGLVITPAGTCEFKKHGLCSPNEFEYIDYEVPIKSEMDEYKTLSAFKIGKFSCEDRIQELKEEARGKLSKAEYEKVKTKYDNTLKFIKDTK